MEFRILGPLEVREGDRALHLGGAKHRALLAILLLEANRVVSTDRLIELLWGNEPPETVGNTLQVCVSQLRKILEPGHVRATPYRVLVTQEPGYLIRVAPDQHDLRHFEQLREEARQASSDSHPDMAAAALREALGLWRGPPLADMANEPYAMAQANRLSEMRLSTVEDRIEADLILGRHGELVGELEALVSEHPLRERFRAQLMLALYRSGRQAEASDLFHKTRAVLVEELGMEPGPELQKLFKAILNQDAGLNLASPPAEREPKTTNLPLQLTSFVGRVGEMVEVKRLLLENRLVTLTGAGGVGKTRLAIQIAGGLVKDYRDGVWLVELAPLSDPAAVAQAVATILGIREQARRPLAETLADYLQPRQLLLVLDNCEHLVEASAILIDVLLRRCPDLHVLTTSREALGSSGEFAWRVPSLPVPDSDRPVPLENLIQYEAIALFVERTTVVLGSFDLEDGNALVVANLCRRLDGIPLAIELAVGKLRVLSLEQLATRLSDRFRLLTGGSRTAMPRQQTLQAAVDWSYDLLSEPQRAILRRLSVFAGGIDLEAAEAICAGSGVEAKDVLDGLTELVAKSLVTVETDASQMRYRLLETLRHYGRQKLLEVGEVEEIRERHRDWFLLLAERAEPQLRGPDQLRWLEILEKEHDNIRTAVGWSLEAGDTDSSLRLAGAMGFFWRMHGYSTEGLSWLERAVAENAGAAGHRARVLLWASALAMELGEYPRAEVLGQESVARFLDLGEKWGVGFAYHILGFIAFRQDDMDRAALLLGKSSDAFQDSKDSWGIGLALHSLGFVWWAKGEYARAQEVVSDGLALFREVGDRERIAASVQLLGMVQLAQGNLAVAEGLLNECLVSLKQLGAKHLIGGALYDLGVIARCLGNYERASALLQASFDQHRDLNKKQGTGYALAELGIVALLQGNIDRAEALLKEGLQTLHDLKDKSAVAKSLDGLAATAIAQQRPHRAAALLGAAAAIRQSIGMSIEPFEREGYEELLASVRSCLGELDYARAYDDGRSISLDDSVRLALGNQDPKVPIRGEAPVGEPRQTQLAGLSTSEAEVTEHTSHHRRRQRR